MNGITLAGMLFVIVLLILALGCLVTGQPWSALYAAIVASWIARSTDNEAADLDK
jgi:ACR3 family arsenite efflux pump ArsB